MIQQETEQEKQLNRMDDRNGEVNPYREKQKKQNHQ